MGFVNVGSPFIESIISLKTSPTMEKGGKRKGKTTKKKKEAEDGLVPSLSELKRDKHRSCESVGYSVCSDVQKRRQQENSAFEVIRNCLEHSKKYKHVSSVKLDRLHLLSGASSSRCSWSFHP